jgi:hypothetical protein
VSDAIEEKVVGQIASYCGRLSCRKPIVQDIGPGRRKEFCSETCRRGADRDYKRARAHVELFEEQLRRSQHEVATYGRRADEGVLTDEEVRRLQADARVALGRAAAVAEFAGDDPDRIRAELCALVQAVTPLLDSKQTLIAVRTA